MAQICIALFLTPIGLIEGFYGGRLLSCMFLTLLFMIIFLFLGLICVLYSFFFALLWLLHFFGWKYNSMRLLIAHSAACGLLAISNLIAILVILFSDIHNGALMNFPPIRHQIQVAIIEAALAIALFVICGCSSWTHADRVQNFSSSRRRFLFAMKALGTFFLFRGSKI